MLVEKFLTAIVGVGVAEARSKETISGSNRMCQGERRKSGDMNRPHDVVHRLFLPTAFIEERGSAPRKLGVGPSRAPASRSRGIDRGIASVVARNGVW